MPPPTELPIRELYAAANFPHLPLGLEPADVPPGAFEKVAVWLDDRPAAARAARHVRGGKVIRGRSTPQRCVTFRVRGNDGLYLCIDGGMR